MSTWPSRKLANELPLAARPGGGGQRGLVGVEYEGALLVVRIGAVSLQPARVHAELKAVVALQPAEVSAICKRVVDLLAGVLHLIGPVLQAVAELDAGQDVAGRIQARQPDLRKIPVARCDPRPDLRLARVTCAEVIDRELARTESRD